MRKEITCSRCEIIVEEEESVELENGEMLCFGCDSKRLSELNFVE